MAAFTFICCHPSTGLRPLFYRAKKAANAKIRNLNMSTWQAEKTKYLNMSREERRAAAGAKTISLSSVETWKEYSDNGDLKSKFKSSAEDVAEYGKTRIDLSKNSELCAKVSIFKGSITDLEVDAIVNAANSALKKGGGVDGAIHRAAGQHLQEECLTLGGCRTGDAKITGAYKLPAKHIIHTVGPQDKSSEALTMCYDRCFKVATENKLRSIAFPCIGTGVYGFPNKLACHIACARTRKFLENNDAFERVIFCLFLPQDVDIYENVMQMYFPL